MNFLLTFPTTCAAVYLLRKPIKRWPVVFYLCAIALDTLYLASGFIVLPRWLWGILVELVQRCELALALFAIVMLIGCLDSTSVSIAASALFGESYRSSPGYSP